MTEMDKLEEYLKKKGIRHERIKSQAQRINQIIVYEDGSRIWDAVCHLGSYGHKQGLLEVWGCYLTGQAEPIGWLTAEKVIALIEEKNEIS